jgi:hypothetical protein
LLSSLHFAERQSDDSIEQNKTEAQPEAAAVPTMIVSEAMSRSRAADGFSRMKPLLTGLAQHETPQPAATRPHDRRRAPH